MPIMRVFGFLAYAACAAIGAIVLLWLALTASLTFAHASSLDEIRRGTLMLYNGADGFCSGTLIAPDLILSAAHCANEGDGVNVRLQTLDEGEVVLSEKIVYVKPVRTLKEWDVALFSPLDPKVNFVQAFGDSVAVIDIASGDEAKTLKFGDRVLAFGYPKAFQLQVTDGLFSGTKVLKGMYEHATYKISAPITGGNSGGGLYTYVCPPTDTLKQCGYALIGVNVAGMRDVSFMNYAAPYAAIMAVTQGFVMAKLMEQIGDKPGEGTDSK